jgi:NAD(P)H-dependent nitrite reductase small subunit
MRVTVCKLEKFSENTARVVEANDSEVAVFNLDGELFAIDNSCAHKQQPLADGVVRDGIVTCPAHLWRYDVRTGERVDSPGWSVACYAVSVVDGDIVVDTPEPAPQVPIREQLLQHAREWSRDV